MIKLRMVVTVLLVVVFFVVGGCRRNNVESESQLQSEEAVDPAEVLDTLMKEIDALDGVVAIEHMKNLVADEEYTMFKSTIAERLIGAILQENSLIEAQNAYLKLATDDEVVARAGYRQVLQATTTTNVADVTAWYEKILLSPVFGQMKVHTWILLVQSQADSGTIMPLVERLDEIIALPENSLSHDVIASIARQGLAMKDFSGLKALSDAVSSKVADRDDLMLLMLVTEGDILLQKGMLAEAKIFLDKNSDRLDDAKTKSISLKLLRACLATKNGTIAESLVATSLLKGDENPQTRNAIARLWVKNAVDIKSPKEFSKRINEAMAGGCSQAHFMSVFRNGFYMVMTSGDSAVQASCMALAKKMNESDEISDSEKQSMSLLLLDGAFYRNDFLEAYELVKTGVPGYDEKWHIEMLDKVGAHLALQENRFEDAIVLFRKHMKRVEAWTEPVVNPTNGARMTREAVLGFNEKRIGDIYKGMDGHAEDSTAAYLRARDWYQKALDSVESDSIEYKLATQELKLVP